MPNVMSRIEAKSPEPAGQRSPILDIVMCSVPDRIIEEPDQLRRFPTEVRLMIFTELLTLWPKTIFRGAYEFGPLDKKEFDEEIGVQWQILLTCRKYHDEAAPILYANNRFVFCTGVRGEPGAFWRFPISARYMPYLTDLGVYFRADDPKAIGSHRVGLFLTSIARRATKLHNLVVLASSDRYYDNHCKWDILFNNHPVCKALLEMLERKTVRHLKIRMHNDAFLFPTFARFLEQEFRKYGDTEERSLTFSTSCTCPKGCPYHPLQFCFLCGWDYQMQDTRPIETIVDPGTIEAGMERMMDMQDELFTLGILPPKDEDEEEEEEEEEEEAGMICGTYRRPLKDTYEEYLPAFTSGMYATTAPKSSPNPGGQSYMFWASPLISLGFFPDKFVAIVACPRHPRSGASDRRRCLTTSMSSTTTTTYRGPSVQTNFSWNNPNRTYVTVPDFIL